MTERIKVDLSDAEYRTLVVMAEQEMRPLVDQARWLIALGLMVWQREQALRTMGHPT